MSEVSHYGTHSKLCSAEAVLHYASPTRRLLLGEGLPPPSIRTKCHVVSSVTPLPHSRPGGWSGEILYTCFREPGLIP